ncbi:MAG: hypothetical protein II592_06320 [Muribaculaceae bacterium]|nr:hypothetical protein [Muribaculaceae bacterium]MBQ4139135.1 hypothetical protein [Muribaculaceae bacterium]
MRHKIAHIVRSLLLTSLLCVLMPACSKSPGEVPRPAPAVYYWRTVMRLDSTERDFLRQHGIKKMYVRYFDVVVKNGVLMPNATLHFSEPMPEGLEIVPTVFIMNNCLEADTTQLAQLLVDRLVQMSETNHVQGVKEVQVDFDWTVRNREAYYALLERMRTLLTARGLGLSATIRLHQLAMPAPPVDYGALMMYNTGNARDYTCENPILDYRDVEPYLKHLADYDLPLCAAYPDFSWHLHFRQQQFQGTLYDVNLNDSTLFYRTAPGKYLVIGSSDLPSGGSDDALSAHIRAGDEVLLRQVPASVIVKVHDELSRLRPEINRQVIIYDLDSKNINNYQNSDYEKIYHP